MTDVPDSDPTPAEIVLAAAVPLGGARHGHVRLDACPNCGTAFDPGRPMPNFCGQCGQAAVLHPPSVGEFAHEFVGHYIALEGPLWRTLRLLLTRPGELTREYLRGRRRRYVLPLRLYLSASFLFFLTFRLSPHVDLVRTLDLDHPVSASAAASTAGDGDEDDEDIRAAIRRARAAAAAASRTAGSAPSEGASGPAAGLGESGIQCDADDKPCNWFKRHVDEIQTRWKRDPEGAREAFKAHWLGTAPYAVFLLQPLFAGLVQLAYRRRRMRFGEHLVFSMHTHALWFLAGFLAVLLPGVATNWVIVAVCIYTLIAMRHVYGGRWRATLARGAMVSLPYLMLLGFATAAISIMAIMN